MGFFNNFPYTNFHDLNLNWIMDKVREWGEKVAELSEDVTDMKSMFHSLQDYVTHFFDSLVIKQAVAEKLEQMLRDGELDDILGLNIVRWGDLRQNELNGRPIMRERDDYYDNTGHTISMQNGIVYSPSGDYSMEAPVKYIYFWRTNSADENTSLCTFVCYTDNIALPPPTGVNTIRDNEIIHSLSVPEGNHGGAFCIKDDVLYAITENKSGESIIRYLYKFDISNPAHPSIIKYSATQYGKPLQPNITCANLVGWLPYLDEETGLPTEHGVWLGVTDKANGHELHSSVYEISEDFETQVWKFDLESPTNIVTQDFKYNPDRFEIYQTCTNPNVINIYSALDGHILNTVRLPKQHMSYVNTGEMEWTDIHDNMVYVGSMHVVGVAGDLYAEFNAWGCNLLALNDVRTVNNIVSGRRVFYVDSENRPYNTQTPSAGGIGKLAKYNVPFATNGGWNHHFAYVEDAMNAVRDLQGGEVSITYGYNWSFHVPYSCELRLATGTIKHPFKIDKDVVCNIRGMNIDFHDTEWYGVQTLSRGVSSGQTSCNVRYNICIDVGAFVTTTALSNNTVHLTPNTSLTKYALCVDRGTLITTGTSFIENALFANAVLRGTGHVIRNVGFVASMIDCRWWDLFYSGTQNVDSLAIMRCPMVCSTSSNSESPDERPTINQFAEPGESHNIPVKSIAFPTPGAAGICSPLPIFTAAAAGGSSATNAGFVSSDGNYTQFHYDIEHISRQVDVDGGGNNGGWTFTGHYYKMTGVSAPSGYGDWLCVILPVEKR